MPSLPTRDTVVCLDSSSERLRKLQTRLEVEHIEATCTQSASNCLEITAECHPKAVLLDANFLRVDQESIPEYIARISLSTAVLLMVDDPERWRHKKPPFVQEVVRRGDLDLIVSLLRQIGQSARS